jgi:glucokinase
VSEPCAAEGVAFGIDIGGTKVLGVAVTRDGEVVGEARVATPEAAVEPAGSRPGPVGEEVADAVAEVVLALRQEARTAAAGAGEPPVGVGVPGMLNRQGVLVFSPNLQGAAGVDFRCLLTQRLSGTSLVVENDANCAAVAEFHLGTARGAEHVLVVTLGTGIGGGLITGGKVLVGGQGFAGEIGHMVVDPAGPPCRCGRRGCWERYASGGGLGLLAREAAYAGRLHEVVVRAGGDPELVRGEDVTRAAMEGHRGALGVMDELGWWVALGLANLSAVLDPQRIVIGGGLVEAGEVLLDPVRRAFRELVEGSSVRPPVQIVLAALGERAGAVGAALAARAGGL